MKLHGLHVAERHNTRIEGDGCASALVDGRITRELAIDPAIATGRNDRRFRHNGEV